MTERRILLVEDNDTIVLGLRYLLSQEGFTPVIAKDLTSAKQKLLEGEYVLALLDVSLPDGDGFDFCKMIRNKRSGIPVIFLTAREDERDIVKGFDLGAEDYVIKPFRNRELISRIRNVLRRNGGEGNRQENEVTCGSLRLNPETGKVFQGEKEIRLTKLEFRILSSMLSHPGKIFAREEILASEWDLYGNYVNDNTLSVTMKRIREKLGDVDGTKIKTVRGLGYRLEEQ